MVKFGNTCCVGSVAAYMAVSELNGLAGHFLSNIRGTGQELVNVICRGVLYNVVIRLVNLIPKISVSHSQNPKSQDTHSEPNNGDLVSRDQLIGRLQRNGGHDVRMF